MTAIEGSCGFHEVNTVVKEALREWMTKTVHARVISRMSREDSERSKRSSRKQLERDGSARSKRSSGKQLERDGSARSGRRKMRVPRSSSEYSGASSAGSVISMRSSRRRGKGGKGLARSLTDVIDSDGDDTSDGTASKGNRLSLPHVSFFDELTTDASMTGTLPRRRADAAGANQPGSHDATVVDGVQRRRHVLPLPSDNDAALSTDGESDDGDEDNDDDAGDGRRKELMSPVLFTGDRGAREQRTSPLRSAGRTPPLRRRALLLLRRSRKRRPPLIDVTLHEFEERVQDADALCVMRYDSS